MSVQLLLVVEKPDLTNVENREKWDSYIDNVREIATKDKTLSVLCENVVLLTIDGPLNGVRDVLSRLHGMDYKYALFDSEILWHEVKADG